MITTGFTHHVYLGLVAICCDLASQNAGSSHAVAANLQKVLFDLKQHNPIYCNDVVVSDIRMEDRYVHV